MKSPLNFAVIGVAGNVAPRHLTAIRDTGNRLAAAMDPRDSVALIDQFSLEARFFSEIEPFELHLDHLRHLLPEERVHYVSVCSPNYLHLAHCRLALRAGANVICEKPLVMNPWDLDALQELETETRLKVNTVLQLRVHPELLKLKAQLDEEKPDVQHEVVLSYVTGRGNWYHVSWKGQVEKSGGVGTNIGIHLFDLLIWLFGPVLSTKLFFGDSRRMSGLIELQKARVRWFLSVDPDDLPQAVRRKMGTTYRSIAVDGQELDFSEGLPDLHTRVYEQTLAGSGFGITQARPSIVLTYRIRESEISSVDAALAHPFLKAG